MVAGRRGWSGPAGRMGADCWSARHGGRAGRGFSAGPSPARLAVEQRVTAVAVPPLRRPPAGVRPAPPGGGGGMGGTVCEAPCARGPGSGPAGEVPGGVADALGMAPARGKHESSPTALVARAWPANAIFYRAVCRKGLAEGEGTGFCCSRLDVIVSSLFEGDRAPAVVKTVLGVTERVTRPSVAKDKTCLALSTMVVTA